ncbi:MAG: prepilin-type N-terminal cleavage/methylation domain-containing protein [Elusimicrobiota bacterium]
MRSKARAGRGFTLVEMMIVITTMGILASVFAPKFGDILEKSQEGATKGKLGSIRSAVTIYYADNEGRFPSAEKSKKGSPVLQDALVPKYLSDIPEARVASHHPPSRLVHAMEKAPDKKHDNGYWGYGSVETGAGWGNVWVLCNHTDSKGTLWTTY